MVPRDEQLCQFDPRAKWQTENSELEILPLSLGSTLVLIYESAPSQVSCSSREVLIGLNKIFAVCVGGYGGIVCHRKCSALRARI